MIRLWECPPDFALDQLRMMRPTSVRTCEGENLVHQYHSEIAHTFRNYYADTALPRWSNNTEFLGNPIETCCDQLIPETYQNRVRFQ